MKAVTQDTRTQDHPMKMNVGGKSRQVKVLLHTAQLIVKFWKSLPEDGDKDHQRGWGLNEFMEVWAISNYEH